MQAMRTQGPGCESAVYATSRTTRGKNTPAIRPGSVRCESVEIHGIRANGRESGQVRTDRSDGVSVKSCIKGTLCVRYGV